MTDVWSRAAAEFRENEPRWASPANLAQALDPDYVLTPALRLIDEALVDVAAGRCKRLMISMPPQEGKTTTAAQWFPLWLLQHRPDTHVVIASYEQQIAERNGRAIRDAIATYDGTGGTTDLGMTVRRDDRAVGRWTLTGRKGGVYSVGIGGALTGRRADILIVDDPTKGFEEAQSSAQRERVWEWWRTVARTRLSPDAAVVVIATRWHAQDLPGKLLADASEDWQVINLPAIADSRNDPLGREVGEPLVSARGRTLADWEATRKAVGEYTWGALYQGRPSPLAGGIFARDKVRFWSPTQFGEDMALDLVDRVVLLRDCWTFCVADLAASTRTSADFTVIATFAVWLDGQDIVMLDMHRERMKPSGHLEAARPMFQRWGAHTLFIESTFHSATLTYEATRAGIPVQELKADTDKLTRALPAAARVEQGRFWLPQGAPWVEDVLNELAAFPTGAHDDIVDCVAYAARIAATHYVRPVAWIPPRLDPQESAFERAIDEIYGHGVDLMSVPW